MAPVCSGLAILAGSFSFMGSAQAVTLLSEDFEGSVNVFAAPTYNYALNYTAPNSLVPGGGITYMHGGTGTSGSASSKIFMATGGPINLLTGGITGGQIDGGLVTYNLYAQFSTYLSQNDNGTVFVQFLKADSSPLGSALQIGGSAFVSALGSDAAGYRDWGADSLTGFVPSGARSASVLLFETKTPNGSNIDGYVDNVNFSISLVPEPGAMTLLALGGGLAAWVRRRR